MRTKAYPWTCHVAPSKVLASRRLFHHWKRTVLIGFVPLFTRSPKLVHHISNFLSSFNTGIHHRRVNGHFIFRYCSSIHARHWANVHFLQPDALADLFRPKLKYLIAMDECSPNLETIDDNRAATGPFYHRNFPCSGEFRYHTISIAGYFEQNEHQIVCKLSNIFVMIIHHQNAAAGTSAATQQIKSAVSLFSMTIQMPFHWNQD